MDELEVKIPSETETILNNNLVLSGETKANHNFINFGFIKSQLFDNGFQFPKTNNIVTTKLRNPKTNLTINI